METFLRRAILALSPALIAFHRAAFRAISLQNIIKEPLGTPIGRPTISPFVRLTARLR
jgi:hypothetical protein